jgi:drug/metabolite transporter (DMT)-like permease
MSPSSTHSDRTVLGIGLAFVAFAVLSVSDAMTKLLSSGYSVFEIAAIDAVIALLTAVPLIVRQEGWASLRPNRPVVVILRCALGAGSLVAAFLAFSMIPLADAYALAFIAPLVVTALSVPVLGEHVGWRQWMAVLVGFVAVMVILRPDFGGIGAGQFFMLASAILFAVSMLILRRIAKTEPSGALVVAYFAMLFIIGLPVTFAEWKTPTAGDFAVMVLTGVCSGLGNVVLIHAFRKASATIVSSFMYSQLIWGTAFGLVLFGDLPDLVTIAGAIVIMVCGIYTLWHASSGGRVAA